MLVSRKEYINTIFGGEVCGRRCTPDFDADLYVKGKNIHLGDNNDPRLLTRFAGIWLTLGKPDNVKFRLFGGKISVYRTLNRTIFGWEVKTEPQPIFQAVWRGY